MNDIDISIEDISNLYIKINSVKEKLNSLSIAISRVNKADLSNAYLLDNAKTTIDDCNKLEIELLNYKVEKILRILSIDPEELKKQFESPEEYYDDSSLTSDGFNYVTDPEELAERFEKGLVITESLPHRYARKYGITPTEAQNYLVSQIEEEWNNPNYSPREKSINAELKLLELGALVDAKPCYKYNGGRGNPDGTRSKVETKTVLYGSDCNNKTSWITFGPPNTEGTWMSVPEFAEAGRETSYEKLQPADIAVRAYDPDGTPGHVVTIIKNCPETGECYISEESGPYEATKLHKVSYDYLEDNGLLPRDMGCFYGEW